MPTTEPGILSVMGIFRQLPQVGLALPLGKAWAYRLQVPAHRTEVSTS